MGESVAVNEAMDEADVWPRQLSHAVSKHLRNLIASLLIA